MHDTLLEKLWFEGCRMTRFTGTHGPFEACHKCGHKTLGVLSVGGDVLNKRCTNCRAEVHVPLPPLRKKAMYLDQFLFSGIYKVRNSGRLPEGHEAFVKEVSERLARCVLLQQVVLPHSDIHRRETIVYAQGKVLREFYEIFGGGVELKNRQSIELAQTLKFAEAFFGGHEPEISFSLDDVTDKSRDDWLPTIHIGVSADYSGFAPDIRRVRGEGHVDLKGLVETWVKKRPSFSTVLEHEFSQFSAVKINALSKLLIAAQGNDVEIYNPARMSPIYIEFIEIERLLRAMGVPEDDHLQRIVDFWRWDKNRELPQNKISAYLFAAVSQRIATGGKKIVDRGLLNDISAVSTYAPYMDAMFLDNRFAALLSEEPLVTELNYKARIYSLRSKDAFLAYLTEIEDERRMKCGTLPRAYMVWPEDRRAKRGYGQRQGFSACLKNRLWLRGAGGWVLGLPHTLMGRLPEAKAIPEFLDSSGVAPFRRVEVVGYAFLCSTHLKGAGWRGTRGPDGRWPRLCLGGVW